MIKQSNCYIIGSNQWLVKLINIDLSFLILPYAGNTQPLFTYEMRLWIFYYFRYFIYTKIVTILIQGQSAGNNSPIWIGTSETTRNNIESNNIQRSNSQENIEGVSEHVPTHLKPQTDEAFGHYLAGLIDGDGTSSKYRITIAFNVLDASLAYYIKKRIGYGTVRKIEDKNAILLTITKREGLEKVINLINGKLRVQFKIDAINKNIINAYSGSFVSGATPRGASGAYQIKDELHLNTSSDLDNHWLAGFLDADGSFQIKTLVSSAPAQGVAIGEALASPRISGSRRVEIRLYVQIDQESRRLLDLIKDKFGGNIGYKKSQDSYYYSSTSFSSAKKFIWYLDRYHLLSSKHLNYLKWRKAYRLVQSQKHLTLEGQEKIKKLKSTMISYSN